MSSLVKSLLVTFLLTPALRADQRPHWMWAAEDRQPGQAVVFNKSFFIATEVRSAELRGVADFNELEIFLNRRSVAAIENYSPLFTIDVTAYIQRGHNQLRLQSTSSAGPAAVFVRLDLQFKDGSSESILTDESWQANGKAATSLGRVADEPWGVTTRQVGIDAFDDYTQWKQALNADRGTDPSSFQIAPGFEIELLHSATAAEGSWVSLAVDPQGRLVIAKEDTGLLRMTLSPDGTKIEKVETISNTLKECRGLLFAFDSLYVNANNSKGFYRLRDTTGDDQFDEVQRLRKFPGNVGHGRNDLALGPDNKIYSIHGDAVDVPTDMIDHTSPFRENRRGKKIGEGYVIRTDRDGKTWELLTAGLRNPYGIDFNAHGQAFTYDADAEHDMGSPWYRPTQVKHLVTGGDFGWRAVTGSWPPYFPDHPDNTPATLAIGKGSPTGVKFGTNSNFPPKYKQALFILDWSYGRIITVHMTPRGASYACRGETFVKGRPLNVTDLDFGHDGALYFVTGGRKTQAGLYRVRYVGPLVKNPASTAQQIARREHARESRRTLTRLGRRADLDVIWSHLADPDPTIRSAARFALEHHAIAHWQQRALTEQDSAKSINALLALARSEDKHAAAAVMATLQQIPLTKLTATQKLMALQAYSLCLAHAELTKADTKRIVAHLDALYPDRSNHVNQQLSLLFAQLAAPKTVARVMPLLASAGNQREQFHYLFALRNVREGWTIEDRQAYFGALNQTRDYLGGAGLRGFVQKIRAEAMATLNDQEKTALQSMLNANPETTAPPPAVRPFVKKWTLEELAGASSGSKPRNVARGREMFLAALCHRCHRVGLTGTLVGPDLTAASRRYSRRDLLDAILSPSKVIPDNYRSVIVETADGKVHTGRVIPSGDFRSPTLRLATNPDAPHDVVEINKIDIVQQKRSSVSWMPEGLLDTLHADEILDLVAFIEAGGRVPQQAPTTRRN